MLVIYCGCGGLQGGVYCYVLVVDVICGIYLYDQLDGCIMLVGIIVLGLNDLWVMLVSLVYFGVEIYVNLIVFIIDDDFKICFDFVVGYDGLQVVLVGLLLGLLLFVLGLLVLVLLLLGMVVVLGGFNYWFYDSVGLVLLLVFLLLLVVLLFISNLVWGYLFEYCNCKVIVNLFGEYVVFELVVEMVVNLVSYNMEGEICELIVMFFDVCGFIIIFESLQFNELCEYINMYFIVMFEDICGNCGMFDKYIGDVVMVFWGVFLDVFDYVVCVVVMVLKMQQIMLLFNEEFMCCNWLLLKIGIGLNSGQMCVGDMGLCICKVYMVMGDVVNLFLCLELIIKVYGVGVMVGDVMCQVVLQFVYCELDWVWVKGKNEFVLIFELLVIESEFDVGLCVEVE